MVAELSERIIVQEIVDEPDPVQDQILEQSQQRKVLMNMCVCVCVCVCHTHTHTTHKHIHYIVLNMVLGNIYIGVQHCTVKYTNTHMYIYICVNVCVCVYVCVGGGADAAPVGRDDAQRAQGTPGLRQHRAPPHPRIKVL